MTDTRTLREVTVLQARAFDEMEKAVDNGKIERAAHLAAVCTACTLIRATALPARNSVLDDILEGF
jgi:hypothetical protein